VVQRQRCRNGVNPARLTLGEPICGVIQWPIQGRVHEYRALLIFTKGQGVGGAAPNRVQRLQTAFGSPVAYAPGSPPAMESGLITPSALIRSGAAKGVTSRPALGAQPSLYRDLLSRSARHAFRRGERLCFDELL